MSIGFIRSLALAVPVLGLISCTVYKQPDPWQRKVHAEWIEDRQVHAATLTALTAPTVPVDAKLIFDGTEIVSGTVTSSCKSESPTIPLVKRSGKVTASNLGLAELLPKEIWRQFGWTAESSISCSFVFDVANEAGSTWSFEVPAMTVKRLDQLVNLKFLKPVDTLSSSDPSFEFDGLENTADGTTTIDLVCEKSRNSVTVTKSTPTAALAHALVFGPLDPQYGPVDQRDIYQNQKCQFAFESIDEAGVAKHRLSQIYAIKFNDPAIEYKQTQLSLPNGESFADATAAKVLEISLKNNSSAPQRFQLFAAHDKNISLQFVLDTHEDLRVFQEVAAHLEFHSSIKPAVDDSTNLIYEVLPGQTLNLFADLQRDSHCVFSDLPIANLDQYRNRQGLNAGVFYEYSTGHIIGIVRKQVDKPDDVRNFDIDYGQKSSTEGVYPGWAPINNWRMVHGDAAPTVVIFPPDRCAPKGTALF